MERNWSVEDLVGGLWRVGRTDSEQQLQDYLRRVPSGTWPGPPPTEYQAQQQAQLVDAVNAQAAYAQAMQQITTGNKPTEMVPPGASANNGMQRVASLDMLRALVLQQGQGQHPHALSSQNSGMHAPPTRPMANTPIPQPVDVKNLSLAMQGKQANNLHVQNVSELDTKDMDKTEIRKARRMLSNRESARRSRRRKQEHLDTLEAKLKATDRENASLKKKVNDLTGKLKKMQQDYAKLEEALKSVKKTEVQTTNSDVKIEATNVPEEMEKKPTDNLLSEQSNGNGNGNVSGNGDQGALNQNGDESRQSENAEENVRIEEKKRKNSVEEIAKRMKTKTDLTNGHRESWQDLTKAEQDRLVH